MHFLAFHRFMSSQVQACYGHCHRQANALEFSWGFEFVSLVPCQFLVLGFEFVAFRVLGVRADEMSAEATVAGKKQAHAHGRRAGGP